jgi:hypothetical protein
MLNNTSSKKPLSPNTSDRPYSVASLNENELMEEKLRVSPFKTEKSFLQALEKTLSNMKKEVDKVNDTIWILISIPKQGTQAHKKSMTKAIHVLQKQIARVKQAEQTSATLSRGLTYLKDIIIEVKNWNAFQSLTAYNLDSFIDYANDYDRHQALEKNEYMQAALDHSVASQPMN